MAPSKVEIVRLGVPRLSAGERAQALGRQPLSDLLRDGGAQLSLKSEHAARLTVVGSGPDLDLVGCPNELRGDAHPIHLGANRALDQIRRIQLPTDLGECLGRALVGHDRGPTDDAQVFGIDLT